LVFLGKHGRGNHHESSAVGHHCRVAEHEAQTFADYAPDPFTWTTPDGR
jgi:hypothetical protein